MNLDKKKFEPVMKRRTHKAVIGRVERVDIIEADIFKVPAKIDTGAYRTSVWASHIHEEDGVLFFTLLGPTSPWYSGKELQVSNFEIVEVENSFGHKENRYSVHIKIKIGTKIVNSNITLSDRSTKIYPILIGRKLLKGKFIVDVSEGEPLIDEESEEL